MTGERAGARGALTVVGTGIKFRAHMTLESLAAIESAEKVLYVTAELMTARWLHELNATAEHLHGYLPDRPRKETYELWVERVLEAVRSGLRTTAVTYGHPGVLVHFTREAIRRARDEGYEATMLPGIGADACLVCDLLADPGPNGWQSYPATRFLNRKPRFDTATPLVLWQLRVVDQVGPPVGIARPGLARLTEYLLEHYPPEHEVVVYEASRNEAIGPVLQALPLSRLPEIRFRVSATLYVPALAR